MGEIYDAMSIIRRHHQAHLVRGSDRGRVGGRVRVGARVRVKVGVRVGVGLGIGLGVGLASDLILYAHPVLARDRQREQLLRAHLGLGLLGLGLLGLGY